MTSASERSLDWEQLLPILGGASLVPAPRVIGGLSTSTLLTLFVLPALYRRFETAPGTGPR